MATRTLSPKRLTERARLHRQAVMLLARLAAKRAVQEQLRAQGVRVSLVPPRNIAEKASAYLAAHPELYQLALQRAHKLGYIDPRGANLINKCTKRGAAKINYFCRAYLRCVNDRHRAGNSMAASAAISWASEEARNKERR